MTPTQWPNPSWGQSSFADSEKRLAGIPWRSALSLLAGHRYPLNTRLVVAHFVSDRRLRRDETWPSGIRFVPGVFIRFHGGFYSSKVMAKLQNSLVLSYSYTCYENPESSCRLHSPTVDTPESAA
jgi:hypothetical protein